jgi:hypothetical protein
MKAQRGQSMTEFAVCAGVLALLLLGTTTIGGYQEAQRRAISAARQAAFEGGWLDQRTGSQPLQERLASLHFDDSGLSDATGRSRVVARESVRVTGATVQVPGRGAIATEFLLKPLRAAGGFLGGGFDLNDSGFRTGIVSVETNGENQLPAPFRGLQLRFEQPYALLTDAWSAADPHHVARRAGGLVPGHALASMSGLWGGLSAPLSLLEPSLRQLCLGLIEPDRVPEDRLEAGTELVRASC